MAVKFKDLLEAYQATDMGSEYNAITYLDRQSGTFYFQSDFDETLNDELPEGVDDGRLLALPDKRDLRLGKSLVLDFASAVMPGDLDTVRDIFSRRGAYGRFRSFLVQRGALEQWYDFSSKAEAAALRAWCEETELDVED